MEEFRYPSDEEITAACEQGTHAVIALFRRVLAPTHDSPELRPTVNQGDVYWVPLKASDGMDAEYIHPHVVIQEDVINHSRVTSVVVCALTTNIKRAALPGCVLLEPGEANLPRQSVVEVSKVSAVDKTRLGTYIGSLSPRRVQEILAGMRFLQRMTGPRE